MVIGIFWHIAFEGVFGGLEPGRQYGVHRSKFDALLDARGAGQVPKGRWGQIAHYTGHNARGQQQDGDGDLSLGFQ